MFRLEDSLEAGIVGADEVVAWVWRSSRCVTFLALWRSFLYVFLIFSWSHLEIMYSSVQSLSVRSLGNEWSARLFHCISCCKVCQTYISVRAIPQGRCEVRG